eukprot:TRINITY_DN6602_c0_g1_i3.p1 TRINITY_DN6602_c0_g1~~TRINITY_DN6602_c0_g1_i3.p1  ORF type:complete len:112 (-),score=16.97 TRINITY_DN6602_c0_g1_i3:53-388(-)
MINPVCLNLEALIIPLNTQGLKRDVLRIVIRTFTTFACAAVALFVPFFDRMVEFVGSFCSISVSVIFPTMCYLKLCAKSLSPTEKILNLMILCAGIIMAITGTYSSITASE